MADSSRRDVVLFLGAGFSAHADLPTMANFGAYSRRERYALRNGPWAARHLLCRAAEVYERFADYCQKAMRSVAVDSDNMEELFSIAEAMANSGVEGIPGPPPLSLETDVIPSIKLWLWKIVHRCPAVNEATGLHEPYVALLNMLKRTGLSSRIAVVTTNYDLTFEFFAWKAATPSNYPFGHEDLAVYPSQMPPYVERCGPGPLVCKLHGSANYFERGNEPGRVHVSRDLVPRHAWEYGNGRIPEQPEPAILGVDAVMKLQEQYGLDLQPAIIPPTYSKLEEKPWLRETWKAALGALSDAKAIVFIGYSMPASDGFMRAMIQAAMAARALKEPPKIWVVDPWAEVHARYRALFANAKVESVQAAFAAAVYTGKMREIIEKVAGLS